MGIRGQLIYLQIVMLISIQIHPLIYIQVHEWEVISKKGKSPLNTTNFRVNKQRHPQYSVQVQKNGRVLITCFQESRVINNG